MASRRARASESQEGSALRGVPSRASGDTLARGGQDLDCPPSSRHSNDHTNHDTIKHQYTATYQNYAIRLDRRVMCRRSKPALGECPKAACVSKLESTYFPSPFLIEKEKNHACFVCGVLAVNNVTVPPEAVRVRSFPRRPLQDQRPLRVPYGPGCLALAPRLSSLKRRLFPDEL